MSDPLTPAQVRALRFLRDSDPRGRTIWWPIEVSKRTRSACERRGLVEKIVVTVAGLSAWRITDAGRTALSLSETRDAG